MPAAYLSPLSLTSFFTVAGQDEDHGALPLEYAATSPEAKGGHYYGPAGFMEFSGAPVEVRASSLALDTAAAVRLWTVSEQLTDVRYLTD